MKIIIKDLKTKDLVEGFEPCANPDFTKFTLEDIDPVCISFDDCTDDEAKELIEKLVEVGYTSKKDFIKDFIDDYLKE